MVLAFEHQRLELKLFLFFLFLLLLMALLPPEVAIVISHYIDLRYGRILSFILLIDDATFHVLQLRLIYLEMASKFFIFDLTLRMVTRNADRHVGDLFVFLVAHLA